MGSSNVLLLFFVLSTTQVLFVNCTQFEVGNKTNGWDVPKSKDMYNNWASENRFKVDDTLHFSYKKNSDSVMVVTKEEYDKCHSDKPVFQSNDGDSVFKLDRPGSFYFISGTTGHCEKGQKMIVKVLASGSGSDAASPPDQSANQNVTDSPPQDHDKKKNGAATMHAAAAAISFSTIIMSFVGMSFF